MKSGKVFLGLLAGLATGAVLGILFAPDKGSNTRKKILDKGEGYADDVKEKMNDFLDTISDKYEITKQGAKDMLSKGKSAYADVKNETNNIS